MDGRMLAMGAKDRDRLCVIRRVCAGECRQIQAAEMLGLSTRQVRRLVRRVETEGDAGVVSRRRGRPSNRRMDAGTLGRIEGLLRERYADFGPTLAAEKLLELHQIQVSSETIRRMQIRLGLWRAKSRKERREHLPRERRARFGELIQIDGSPHAWFEKRGPVCTLLVFIDDATNRLTSLHFLPTETRAGYVYCLRQQLERHGLPAAFYSDRHGIFRVNAKEAASGDGKTEFGRILDRLNITLIHAHTPQAKGRVERSNQTLQDRLVKELRLQGISDIAAANAFLPTFIAQWNQRFGRTPRDAQDAHRPLTLPPEVLDTTLADQETRLLSRKLTFQFHGAVYLVKTTGFGTALRGAKVTVCRLPNHSVVVQYRGRTLPCTPFRHTPAPPTPADEKTLNAQVDDAVARSFPISVIPRAA